MLRAVLVGAVSGLVFSWAAPLAAQEDEASIRESAAARELFGAGVVCADASDWVCAIDRFERAYALRSSPVIAWNLGHALVERGRLVEAAEMLRRVARDDDASAEVRAAAREALDAILPQLGTLTLHLVGPTQDVQVFVGALELPPALLEMEAPIDPGTHVITARRGDEVIAEVRVEVTPGAFLTRSLELPEPAALASPLRPVALAPPTQSGSDESGVMIGLGVGGALLAVGMAVVLIVVLVPPSEATPFSGSLGFVELGR